MKKFSISCLILLFSLGLRCTVLGAALKSYGFGTACILHDNKRDRVYCAVPAQNSVVVIDSESLQVLATIFTGSQPNSLAQSPDGSQLYVGNLGSSAQGLTVVDLETLAVSRYIATTNPVLKVAVGNGAVYTIESSAIRAYSTASGIALAGSLSSSQGGIFVYGGALGISPDGNTLYFYQTGLSPSTWFRINITTWPGTKVQSGQFGSNGQDLALSRDGQWITFTSGSPYYVNKLQASNPTVSLGQFSTGAYPHAATYSADGNTLYTAHTSGQIDVWNANTYVALSPITTTGEPDFLECDRQGNVLFAGSSTSLFAYLIKPAPAGGTVNAQITQAVEIRWSSVSSYLYQVEWKSTLSGSSDWYSLGGQILGNGLTMSVYDTTRDSRAKFYRVRQVSP
jgi:YVTN family beta-propeller protein